MEKIVLTDDFDLLNIMINDLKHQPNLYKPGPYWIRQMKNAVHEIKKYGISDFRGSSNFIGDSFSDSMFIDIRHAYNHGFKRLVKYAINLYPLNKLFEAQIRLTESFANRYLLNINYELNIKTKTRTLLKKYKVPYSLLGDCKQKVQIDGQDFSSYYLSVLDQHDSLSSRINFNQANTIFEIGGGFGINVHLLLENYKNIKKVLYLDMPPTLYAGTQYLKAFYGNAVHDYGTLKNSSSLKFSDNDDLEIFCIAPWQIEIFKDSIDIFMNSHSFVEMPSFVIKNYVDHFEKFSGSIKSAVALTTYDRFDLSTTIHPNELPKFFNTKKFDYFESENLIDPTRNNLHFVSPGEFAR